MTAPGARPVVTPADVERGRAISRAWRNDPGRTGGSLAAMIAAALAEARAEGREAVLDAPVTCRECEAHVSWCDHPDTHTWKRWTPPLPSQ